jgi:DNA-binding response OmpR family regulator
MSLTSRPKLLAVDADMNTLRTIAEIAAPHYETIRVRDAGVALTICDEDPDVRVIVAEHRPMNGTDSTLLDLVRARKPHVKRIMLTTFADLSVIVHGLHTGSIQHIVHKPVSRVELLAAVGLPVPTVHPVAGGPVGATRLTA